MASLSVGAQYIDSLQSMFCTSQILLWQTKLDSQQRAHNGLEDAKTAGKVCLRETANPCAVETEELVQVLHDSVMTSGVTHWWLQRTML